MKSHCQAKYDIKLQHFDETQSWESEALVFILLKANVCIDFGQILAASVADSNGGRQAARLAHDRIGKLRHDLI